MSDALLPFRPRAGSPLDRVLAGVGAQTSRVRRRLNLILLEHALFVTAGTVALSVTALVMLAFVLSPVGYACATWLTLVVLGATLAVHLRRLRKSWISGAAAAVMIDHRAGLEDRLATLATADAAGRGSRLWNVLLRENLRLLPRWEPRRVAPRLLPKSIWYFICSLLLAALVAYRIPRAAVPSGNPLKTAPVQSRELTGDRTDDAGAAASTRQDEGLTRLWKDLPERVRQAILGRQSPRLFAGSVPPKTAPVRDERNAPAIVGSRIGNSGPVRSEPATEQTRRLAQSSARRPRPGVDRSEAARGPNRPAGAAMPGDAPRTLPKTLRGDAPKSLAKGAVGGAGGGAGAGIGGDKKGLFGERQAPGENAGSFAFDLDALRSGRSDQDGAEGAPRARLDSALGSEQRLDDAVRRAQVPPEYEKIVERLFNRSAENVDSPPAGERDPDRGAW